MCSSDLTLKPVQARYGIYPSAEDAIDAAVFSSACEGLETPPEEIENLRKVARGEISGEDLIKQYMAEAAAKQEALNRV